MECFEMQNLSEEELIALSGGTDEGIFYTIGKIGGIIVRSFWEFAETSVEYQASLDSSVKK